MIAWSPLLDGASAALAIEAVDAIARDLRGLDPAALSGDLAGGAAGIAAFFSYLGHAREDDHAHAHAERWLDAAVETLSSLRYRPALIGGYTGIAWAAAHLCDPDSAAAVCAAVDPALDAYLDSPPAERDYDLISGLAGFGVYLLAAPPSQLRQHLLRRVVGQLDDLAASDRDGLAWFTPAALLPEWQRAICPTGYFNLGLAHGIPAVIALLARCLDQDVEHDRASRLLDGAMTWMLGIAAPRDHGRYPSWRGPGAGVEPARLAWCYGDPGVAVAFHAAARATGRDHWRDETLQLTRLIARRDLARAGVVDAGICHGAAGLAHLLGRLHHATGDDAAGEAARFWLQRVLDLRRPGEGVGGFLAYERRDEQDVWTPQPGLLTGAAGIGLALLAATSDVAPDWDQALGLAF